MLRLVLLCLSVLIISTFAAKETVNGLCYNIVCNGKNGLCDATDDVKFNAYGCKSGYYCNIGTGGNSTGTCQSYSTAGLNGACASSSSNVVVCTDKTYDLACSSVDSNTCKYPPGIGAGESAATCNNYINGNPCANQAYSFSNATTPGCTSCGAALAVSGANCSESFLGNAQFCAKGFYCNAYSGTCQARITSGGCNSTTQCAWTTICSSQSQTSGTQNCVSPFSQKAGSSCLSDYDCVANTFCSGGTCATVSNGAACTLDSTNVQSSCSDGYECVCNGGAGSSTGKCETSAFTQGEINDINSYLSCMGSNCLYELAGAFGYSHSSVQVAYTPDSCVAKSCSSQVSHLNSDGATTACGSDASSLLVSLFLTLFVAFVALL